VVRKPSREREQIRGLALVMEFQRRLVDIVSTDVKAFWAETVGNTANRFWIWENAPQNSFLRLNVLEAIISKALKTSC